MVILFDIQVNTTPVVLNTSISDIDKIKRGAEMINFSTKSVLYIGGGIVKSNCCGLINKL